MRYQINSDLELSVKFSTIDLKNCKSYSLEEEVGHVKETQNDQKKKTKRDGILKDKSKRRHDISKRKT